MFKIPDDPFLKDAEGAAKFTRELLKRLPKWKADFTPAIYWAARWSAHWAQKSKAWSVLG